MDFHSKFNLRDEVYIISYRSKEIKVPTNCPICGDKGSIKLNNREYLCPECRGNTYRIKDAGIYWYVQYKGKIVGIDIHYYTPEYHLAKYFPELRVDYLVACESDNKYSKYVVYPEHERDVFATLEEAQAECDKRNVEENKKFEEKSKKSEVDSD